jgi:MerR family transcriptional regulator, light-induced transcriptional regulator
MAEAQPIDLVTTREAAAILGVGTTSIKRWADRGQLPCVRTAGGHRRFSRAAVLAFRRLGIDELGEEQHAVDPDWVSSWIARLIDPHQGEGEIEAELARERAQRGSWAATADALGAVLEDLGRRWAAGQLSVIEEHLASFKLTRAAALSVHGNPPADAPVALLVAAQGDDHSLGLSLCELVLREMNWATVWVGTRAPTSELSDFITAKRPRLVVMSASAYSTDGVALSGQVERIGEACRQAGATLVVGGRGHWPSALPHGHRLYRFSELEALLAQDPDALT